MTDDGRRSILVIRLSAIGDCVLNSPAVRGLREACPDDFVAWVVEPKSAPVVVGNPYVDRVLVWDRGAKGAFGLRGLARVRRQLRDYRFDVVLDFQGLGRSAVISALSGAPFRATYTNGREGSPAVANYVAPMPSPEEWIVESYCGLLECLAISTTQRKGYIPVSEEARNQAETALHDVGLDGSPLLALQLRGSWVSKFWPLDRFAEVARVAAAERGLSSVVLGGPGDVDEAERLAEMSAVPITNLAGRLPLAVTSAVLERAAAAIGPDTGVIHIAGELGVPVVALFGPTSVSHSAPRGPHARVCFHGYACHPCDRHPTCDTYDCMFAITVDEVLAALREAIEGGAPPSRRELGSPPVDNRVDL